MRSTLVVLAEIRQGRYYDRGLGRRVHLRFGRGFPEQYRAVRDRQSATARSPASSTTNWTNGLRRPCSFWASESGIPLIRSREVRKVLQGDHRDPDAIHPRIRGGGTQHQADRRLVFRQAVFADIQEISSRGWASGHQGKARYARGCLYHGNGELQHILPGDASNSSFSPAGSFSSCSMSPSFLLLK